MTPVLPSLIFCALACGPLLAGKMLALGTGTVGVMAASAPGILLAGVAVFWLMNRQKRAALA